jgi:hypothetical protein
VGKKERRRLGHRPLTDKVTHPDRAPEKFGVQEPAAGITFEEEKGGLPCAATIVITKSLLELRELWGMR